jgi:hypothetical protein
MFLLKTLHIIDFSPKGIQKKELEGRRKRSTPEKICLSGLAE